MSDFENYNKTYCEIEKIKLARDIYQTLLDSIDYKKTITVSELISDYGKYITLFNSTIGVLGMNIKLSIIMNANNPKPYIITIDTCNYDHELKDVEQCRGYYEFKLTLENVYENLQEGKYVYYPLTKWYNAYKLRFNNTEIKSTGISMEKETNVQKFKKTSERISDIIKLDKFDFIIYLLLVFFIFIISVFYWNIN